MDKLTLSNPLFVTYVIGAMLLVLKASSNSWLTIIRMIRVNGGYRSPEDANKTLMNPNADPKQLDKNEHVERIRRVHQNDLENLPFFLVASLAFILVADPSPLLAKALIYGYVILRVGHSAVYLSALPHEARAVFFTPSSLILLFMAGRTLVAALGS